MQILNIRRNNITGDGVCKIAHALKSNRVRHLPHLSSCPVTVEIPFQSLITLNLSDNKAGDEGAVALAEMLRINRVREAYLLIDYRIYRAINDRHCKNWRWQTI